MEARVQECPRIRTTGVSPRRAQVLAGGVMENPAMSSKASQGSRAAAVRP
jgi:hypothetical protein